MYVKDMPSVAASACNEGLDTSRDGRMDEDLVLDGVIDDRIAAAYAIVELGERDSKKITEFASSELDEDLETDDLDHYHQVPRSPEYCRRDRRCKYENRSSSDSSPVRTTSGKSLVESQPPRLGHVRGAVMPSRISGKPEPKLPPKRRVEDEGSGIKAKLARMLSEKKISRADLVSEGSSLDDERETEERFRGSVDSDEERPVESQGGRFVRTSMSILEPVNVISSRTQSPAVCEQQKIKQENLEVKLEQSYFSAEDINRLRESLLRKQLNEESAQCLGVQRNVSPAGYGVSPNFAYRSSSTSLQSRLEVETSAKNVVIPASSSLSPSPAFPSTQMDREPPASGDADVPRLSQFPQQNEARAHFLRESTPLVNIPPSWPIMSGLPPYLFMGPAGKSVLHSTAGLGNNSEVCERRLVQTVVPGTGFVHYYVLPTTRPTPNSADPDSSAGYCDSKVNEPTEVKQDVDDAMTKLENFTLGKQSHGGSLSRPELILSNAGIPYWCLTPQAKSICPRFGSLNSISSYYSMTNNPASSSEAGLYPHNSAVSRSCHDLTRIPSKAPQLQDGPNDLPCRSSPEVKYRRPKSSESAEKSCARRARRTCRNRDKILPTAYALEMVRGGEFGSLTAIRKFYDSPNLSEMSPKKMQFVESRERAGSLSQSNGDGAQDFPLDLTSCRRKFSTEVKRCPSEPQSVSTYETSVPVKITADLSGLWQQNSHTQTGSGERSPSDVLSHQQNANTSKFSDSSSLGVAAERSSNPSLASHSMSHFLPNSSLPPKKRKLRQPSQSRDISEVKTAMPTTSVASTMAYLRQGDYNPDSGAARQSSDVRRATQSEELDMYRQSAIILSPAETGFTLTPEMKLLENKVGVRDEDGDLPLHIAVAKGYLEFVQKVILPMMSQHGVHIDSCNHQRQTALHLAVITNQPQMVETLLRASASANVCDRKGNTAVHLAVRYKTLACLRHILANSRIQLDLDTKNYEGLTALHLGVQLGEKETVKALLANEADPNAMDGTNGRTPLFYAVETNDYVMASVLLKYGSNPCIASYSGCTPLQIATAKSFRDMTNMLERSFPRGFTDQEESYARHV